MVGGSFGGTRIGTAWHSLNFCFSFEPCVCVKRSVYTRTVYVWLCMAHTTQWHETVRLRVTLRFLSGRRAGRRGPFVCLCCLLFSPSQFPQLALLAEFSDPLKIIHIVHLLRGAQKIKGKRRLVKNYADRNLIG